MKLVRVNDGYLRSRVPDAGELFILQDEVPDGLGDLTKGFYWAKSVATGKYFVVSPTTYEEASDEAD